MQDIRGNPFVGGFASKANPKNNEIVGPLVMSHVSAKLKEIHEFIEVYHDQIDIKKKNINQNVNELILVMKGLEEIKTRYEELILCLDTIEETLNYFNKVEVKKDSEKVKCKNLQDQLKKLHLVA